LIEIRRGRIEDAAALRALLESMLEENQAWIRQNAVHLGKEREWIQAWIRDDRAHSADGGKFLFFAFDGDKLVGHVNGMSWAHAPKEFFEKMIRKHGLEGEKPGHLGIAVHKGYRRRGIGSKLIGRALQELREMGVTTVIAAVHVDNKPSLSFFGRVGFAIFESEGKHLWLKEDIVRGVVHDETKGFGAA